MALGHILRRALRGSERRESIPLSDTVLPKHYSRKAQAILLLPKSHGVLLLTGTCGSGKSTVADLISREVGWRKVSEDEVWKDTFHKNRGAFGSDEHRLKRREVHRRVFDEIRASLTAGLNVVVDATVHEAPPESYEDYRSFFTEAGIFCVMRVLHPRLEIAVERDRTRPGWNAGRDRVADLRAKFTGLVFDHEWFLDSSDQTPEETAQACLGLLR